MKNTKENALFVFQSEKVITIDRLAGLLDSSKRTAQRRLKEWRAYGSYNKNGRYYVLPQIAKFDSSGMWKFKNILFSKHGNLRDTLFYFVDNSPAGLSALELSEYLGLPVYSFLSRYNQSWNLPKEKYQGIYIYFSTDTNIFENQRKERENLVRLQVRENLPSSVHSVFILAELIKHPKDSPEQLVRRVYEKGIVTSIDKVRNLLIYHDLLKKTSDSGRFKT